MFKIQIAQLENSITNTGMEKIFKGKLDVERP